MPLLGVNIDHIATIREARRAAVPDPVLAARICERAGCDSIVCHLREDRRHIKDADVAALRRSVTTRLNLEMSIAPDIVDIACRTRPDQATLVPEKRREVTTEGGLDVCRGEAAVARVVARLARSGIAVSLFIDPDEPQIDAAIRTGAGIIELHTGEYANAPTERLRARQLAVLSRACRYARARGIEVNAGHGLDYDTVRPVGRIAGMHELNIGYAIVARAVFTGLDRAVREMRRLAR